MFLFVIAVTLDKLFFLAQSKAASTILLQPFLVVFLIAIAASSDRLNSIPAYSPSVASLKHIKSNFLSGDNDFGSDELNDFLTGEGHFGGEEGQNRYFQNTGDPRLESLKTRGLAFGVESKAFRIKVTVSRGEGTFVLWALLEDSGGTTTRSTTSLSTQAEEARKRFEALKYPYRILALRENENFID